MSSFHDAQPGPETWPQRAWRLLTHPFLLVVLLALMGLALLSHSLVPQLPTVLANDSIARSQWLAVASAMPGGGVFAALGLFDVGNNVALRLILPVLAAILLLRLIERLVLAWRVRSLAPPLGSLPAAHTLDLQHDDPIEAGECEQLIGQSCSRWRGDNPAPGAEEASGENPEDGLRVWYGDRNHRAIWFAPLLEAGLLLTLAALTLNLRLGWQTDLINLNPGEQISLTPLSTASIRLDETPLSEPCCLPGQIAPLILDSQQRLGIVIRQQALNPALAVIATTGGEQLDLHAIEQGGVQSTNLALQFPQARTERAVAIPQRNLFLRIVNTGPHAFTLQVLDASENVLLSQDITAAAALPLDDLTLELTPTYFATLRVVSRPGSWLLIPALALALIGLLLRWRFPYSRLGVRMNEAGVAIRLQSQHGARPSPTAIAQWAEGHST